MGRAAGTGWRRASRWLLIAAAALLPLAAILAGGALRSAHLARTCVDPPGQSGFGCAWGHGLSAFIGGTLAGVVAFAAVAALVLSGVARDAARRDPARRARVLGVAAAAALLAVAVVALQVDGAVGPCLQCRLWEDPSPLLAALGLAWPAVASVALASAAVAFVAGQGLRRLPETVK